jgi:hypothetical protein
MDAQMFDRLTHQRLGERTRREIVGRIAALALASPLNLWAAHDAEARKHARTRCRKQADPCPGQGEQCRSFMVRHCAGNALCEELSLPCCEHFARCDTTEAITCLHQGS